MVQQLHFCHMTDYLQIQYLFYFFYTKIGDFSAAPPLPYDQLT